MKTSTTPEIGEFVFRAPIPSDGKSLHKLATDAGTLDVNSEYAYLLHGLHHASCSVIAEIKGKAAGFISGYWVPQHPCGQSEFEGMRLFIWQVGVHPDFRKQGLARAMLLSILRRDENHLVRYIETTISPSNEASIAVFKSLATSINAEMTAVDTLDASLFSSTHDEETIYRIGPFNPINLMRNNNDKT